MIEGNAQVEALRLRQTKTGEERRLDVDGVFIAVGIAPESELYAGQLELDEQGYIRADESGRTSVPGVFAAGDVRTKALRQIRQRHRTVQTAWHLQSDIFRHNSFLT